MEVIKCPVCGCGAVMGLSDDCKIQIANMGGEVRTTITVKDAPSFRCLKCKKYFIRDEDMGPIAKMVEKINRYEFGL